MKKALGPLMALAILSSLLVPMAAQAQPQPGNPNGASSRPVRNSWTSDRHVVAVGDVVTILVDEYTLASSNRSELASREKDRDLGLQAGSGGTGIKTVNDVSDRTRGERSRTERFSAEISARVMEVTPEGMIRLEGKRKLQVDNHEQEVTIRGWLRTQDLSTQNTVESWRIADAEILYTSNGELGKAGGFWSKLLDIIWP
jgi:flagellar L-ring protein precursor FlgH